MIMIPAAVLGALIGYLRAAKRNGNLLDRLQYAAAHGVFFLLLGLVLSIALDWAGLV